VNLFQNRWAAYGAGVVTVAAATLITFVIQDLVRPSVSLLFFPAVILPSVYVGFGPALVAAVLSMLSIAYCFVPPAFALDLGLDDILRLGVFVGVAAVTAGLSARRRRAEAAQLQSLRELENSVQTLRRISGWPTPIGPDTGASIRQVLEHAAGVVGASAAAVAWESDDEPQVYVVSTADSRGVDDAGASFDWRHEPPHAEIVRRIGDQSAASATFDTDQIAGRVYFTGVNATGDLQTMMTLVAREVGNSLGQLQVSDRVRQLAVHEARIRVSRDLHDGVLQSLTGIRLELQAVAEGAGESADRLRALERALAIEQRELRLFIDELKPASRGIAATDPVAARLNEMCARFSAEWKVPVTLRVTPPDVSVPRTVEQALRLMIHEGVSNALKHGHPSRVSIDLETHDSQLKVVIQDDGLGFPFRGRLEHEELAAFTAGPVSLRERVSALDGRMSVESRPTGSRVEFVIPVG